LFTSAVAQHHQLKPHTRDLERFVQFLSFTQNFLGSCCLSFLADFLLELPLLWQKKKTKGMYIIDIINIWKLLHSGQEIMSYYLSLRRIKAFLSLAVQVSIKFRG
jgi:hypothetical protein